MHTVEQGGFLVIRNFVLVLKDFGLVEQLVVKAKYLFIFGVSGKNWRSHIERLSRK